MQSTEIPYSWGDVADILANARLLGAQPLGLVKAEIYWDQATFYIRSRGDSIPVSNWLARVFPQRIENSYILLDGPGFSSKLPIEFLLYDAQDAGEPPLSLPTQFVAASNQIWFTRKPADFTVLQVGVPTFAFHSVKGGVGRTTSALSFAQSISRDNKFKPLLVDADFEAPGISYLFLNDGRQSLFSLEDLLVLAHADNNKIAADTISFGANRLANQVNGGVTILPCLRNREKLSAFAIRPEQLQRSHEDQPFFLLNILGRLALEAGCDSLIIDLRAGFTDLAAMVLCAPRVAPIFITTPSGQAIESTRQMLNFISREMRMCGVPPVRPAIVVNNVIPQVRRSKEFADVLKALETSADQFIYDGDEGAEAGVPIDLSGEDIKGTPIVILDHAPTLTAAPLGLSDFLDDLQGQACFDQLATGLSGWMQDYVTSSGAFEAKQSSTAEQAESDAGQSLRWDDLKEARRALHKFAEARIFAESVDTDDQEFMMIRALGELADRFKTELPNATCIGMKGAGKTFTFRLLAEMKSWGEFLQRARPSSSSQEALGIRHLLPVLPAKSLQQSSSIISARKQLGEILGFEDPISFSRLNSCIDKASIDLATDSAWADFWLDVIAWSCGLNVEMREAGQQLLMMLRETNIHIIALFDGLEETFQQFRSNQKQQAAIRGLTSSLSQILFEVPRRPLGQISFVRSDLISAAYPINYRQFADRNKGFALTWYDKDILELAVWLTSKAGALPQRPETNETGANPIPRLEEQLRYLWGHKLGKPDELSKGGRTREARSSEWVIAALSDLQGRISARDLVGFVAFSAENSVADDTSSFSDRLLVPKSMSNAIGPVGSRKINAMSEENVGLKPILEQLRQARQFAVPLGLSEFQEKVGDLGNEQLKMLQDNGIILIENASVEMPEIFRTGLGNVVRAKGGRKSIIGLMNRAKLLRSGDDVL